MADLLGAVGIVKLRIDCLSTIRRLADGVDPVDTDGVYGYLI